MDSKFKRLLSLVLALVMVISNVTIVRAEATAEPVQIVLGDKVDTIDSGKTYLIVNTRAGRTMTNRATENNNGLVMEGTTADITSATFWTIEGSDGAYTVKDPNGKYLDMVDGNAGVQDIVDVVSIARNGSTWTISQDGAYLNDHGGGGTRAAGWNGGNASTDPGSQWELYEVVTHKTVGLKVGQEMELTIEGVAHQSGNVADSKIVNLESVKPVVTGSPLKFVKVGNAHSYDGTKKYVFISERSITDGLLTTESYTATISWSGLAINGLKTNGTVSAETEELWTIAPADGGKYAIKHGDKYLTLDYASSSTAGLVDEPCSLSLTRDGNYWYIKNADGDYLSNVGGFGYGYYGASGFNEKSGSGFTIREVAAISEYNTVVTIAGLAEGKTSLKVGSTVYDITVTCDHERTEIRGTKQPTLFEEGYTGDSHCADCGKLKEKGTAISKLTAKNAKILSNNSIIALEDCMYVLIGETNGSRSLVHAGTYYVKPSANGNTVVHTTEKFEQITLETTWNGKAADDHSIRIKGLNDSVPGGGYIHVYTAGKDKPYWDRCTSAHGPKDNGTDGLYLFYKNEDGSGNEIPGYTMVTNGNVQSGKSYLIAAKQGENTWYIMVPTVSTEKLDHIAQLVTDGVTHGHKYTTTTTTATCVNAGVKTETCTCGHFHTSADDAMGHTFERDGGDTNAIKCGDCSVPNPNYKPVEVAPDVSFGGETESETIPEKVRDEITNDIQNNGAVNSYKPVEDHADVEELEITFTAVTFKEEENKHVPTVLVFNVTPKMNGEKVASPSDPITFRLPVPDSVAQAFAKVFHDDVQMPGLFEVKVENDNKYVEIESGNFSKFEVVFTDETPVVNHVAKIGEQGYATLQAAVEAAVLMSGDVTIKVLAGTHAEDINITNGAIGNANNRPNITFLGEEGAVLAGTVTIGYRQQNVAASMWNGNVTFKDITFDHAESEKHSLDIQDVKGIFLTNCVVIGDGDYGIGTPGGNATTVAKFTGCTFKNGAMQVLGQIGANLVVDNCKMENFSFNVQGGAVPGMTIKNSTFDMTLTDAHVGNSFYAVRTNACPVNFEGITVNVDSTVTGTAADQAKWGIFYARKDSNAKWTITDCEVNLTNAAMAQTELLLTKNEAGDANGTDRIVFTNLTSTSNDVAELAARGEGCATVNGSQYNNGVRIIKGSVTIAFTSETGFWGEGGGNATESLVVSVYEGDKVIGTASLNNIDGILNGNVDVTWQMPFAGSSDAYWNVVWAEGYPNVNMAPTKVTMTIDGVEIAENVHQWNAPDNLNPIVALTDEGGTLKAHTKLSGLTGTVYVLRDVTENIASLENVTLVARQNKTRAVNGVTITSTYSDYVDFNNVTVKPGVTVKSAKIFSDGSVNVIEGTLETGTLYNGYDAKTTVQNGGKIITTGMIVNRFHNNADSGIYVYGDGDDTTVEVSCADTIGTYSGTFYAKDAVVNANMLWIDYLKGSTQESDSYSQSKPVFENSVLKVTKELRLYKDATLTLTGSNVTAGTVQVRENATPVVDIDSNSSLKADSILNEDGANLNAVLGADGSVSFKISGLKGTGTEADPYQIGSVEELEFFRDEVNGGNSYAGKYVKLTAGIDLDNEEWTPIGYMGKTFKGTFDGGNFTISNLKITKELDNAAANNGIGFFGRTDDTAVIKNLTIENVDITGSLYVGAVVGYGYTGKSVENVTVKGDITIDAWWYAGVIGGNGYMNLVNNCHVIGNEDSYIKGNNGSYIGGIWGFRGEGNNKITNCSVEGLDIIGVDRVGGICGIGHYGNSISGCAAEDVTITATDPEATTVGLIVGACEGTASEPTVFENNTLTDTTAQIDNGDGTYTKVENLYGTNIDGSESVTNFAAKIGSKIYLTLADAVAAANAGDEIVLLADVTESVTLPAGVTFNGNGKTVNGTIKAGGNLTFKGKTTVSTFNPNGYNNIITIGEGASLKVTSGRMTVSYGNVFNITGSIVDAKTADKTAITPSLELVGGISYNGNGSGVQFNATNAYIKLGDSSTKNSGATGEFYMNFDNCIVDYTKTLKTYMPTTSGLAPKFNFNAKDSVVNFASHLELWLDATTMTLDNTNMTVGGSFANAGKLNVENGSNFVVKAPIMSSHGGNTGTIAVKDASFELKDSNEDWQNAGTMTAEGTGKLITNNFKNVNEGAVVLKSMEASFEGKQGITVTSEVEGYDVAYNETTGKYEFTKAPVAKIGEQKFETLEAAFKAATSGCTIEILQDVTIDYKWDCRDYATNGSHSQFKESVTIKGNGKTIKFTDTVNDNNWNTIFRFEENATVENLTIDISEATGAQRVISAKKSLTVNGLTIIGSAKYGIIFGEGSSATDLAATEIVVKNSTLTGTRRAISDNEGGKDVKSVTVTGNILNANVYVSASESIVFTDNTANGEVDLRSYSADNVLSVEAKGNTLTEGVKNYIYAKSIDAQDEFATENPPVKVSTKAELDAALAAAKDGDTIVLAADIDYGTTQLAITKAITLDLGGKTLTTHNAWGGMSVKGNPTIKNGTIVHASNTAAIKVWNATAFENLVIDVQGKGDANKTIGGIVLQEGSTTRVGSIKNVTIKGAALTNGIETNNCGNATENVIASMENVTIDAKGTGLLISAPCGTATNCNISGDKNAIELWIKGTYSASLTLDSSKVEGGVFAHDEFNSNPGTVNNGTLTLTVDEATTGVEAKDVTLTINHAKEEQVKGEVLEAIIESAQAKVNGTYCATVAEAMAAVTDGATVTIMAGTYDYALVLNPKWNNVTVVGEGDVTLNGVPSIKGTGYKVENIDFVYGTGSGNLSGTGLIKDCSFTATNASGNTFRYCYGVKNGAITFEGCKLNAPAWAVHFDGASGTDLTFTDCEINGRVALAGDLGSLTATGTTFEKGYVNIWGTEDAASFTDCDFVDVPYIFTGYDADNVVNFNGCAVNGDANGKVTDLIHGGVDKANALIYVDEVLQTGVVAIGENRYATLSEAVNAAQAGETIVLLKDATGEVQIPNGAELKLDLNGKTLNGCILPFRGNLTVENGSIVNTNKSVSGIEITVGELVLNNVNITSARHAVRVEGAATVTIDGGVYKVDPTAKGTYHAVNVGGAGGEKITIKGGTFIGPKGTMADSGAAVNIRANAEVAIEGGSFSGGKNSTLSNAGKLTVTGGTFDQNPVAYIPEDYVSEKQEDGTYKVRQLKDLVIHVGPVTTRAIVDVSVATMDEAVAYAQANPADSVTYKISGPVELTTGFAHDILNLGKNVTIEGVTSDAKLTIVGGGVPDIKGVTFKNLTLADEGTYNSHANEFMYQNYIDCSFENVTFVDGIRLSGKSTLTDCTVEANTINEYAIWLDEGEFTMTGSTVTGGNDAYGLIKSDEVDKITIKNNVFQYLGDANKEALNVKGAVIDAQDNTFIDCAKGILPADKTNYAEDGTTVLTETAVVGDNKVIINVAQIGEQKFETLDAAYAAAQNGNEVVILKAGSYKLPTGKNITITGKVDGVVFDNIGAHNMGGANVTFNNVTFDYYPNVNYTGLQHSGNLVYNNCTINGQVFLYGQSETFNNCTFNQNSADAYNVWTYGAKEVDFNNCTFNSVGKAVLVYAESAGITNAISVTNSTFNASAPVDGKAAIEIDTSLTAGATITIDAATTATGFGSGNVSGNSLWNNKKGNNTDANNDVTVKVGDQTVLAPVTFVAKIGEIGYTDLTAALKALKSGDELVLQQDVTITENWDARYTGGKITVPVTINGNGHTIKFTGTINDSNYFAAFRFEADAIVKNLTMDMSEAVGTNNRFRAISAKANLTVDNCHFIGNASVSNTRAIIFGEGAGATVGNVTVSVTDSTFKDWRRGLTDNENGQNAKAVTATGNTFENAGVNISASESIVFTDNDVSGKEVIITSNNGYTESVTVSGNNLTNGATGKVQKAASYDNIQDGFNIVATASVVSGGTVKYFNTLQAAIDAAQDGDVVNLLANSSEDVTVVQTPDKDIVIDGNGNTYSGTITIHGNARHDGAETLTIQNVKFETSEAGHYFIDSNSTGSVERYAHNVTVKESSFTATGAAEHTAAAMRIRQGFNISMQNVDADGMHSMLQAYGNAGVTISGLNATNMKNGISAGTSTDVVIDNVKIEASGYGIRADGTGAYDLTVKNSTVDAELPVVIRNNTASGYELTLENNTLSGNDKGYQVIFTAGDDGTYEAPEVGVKLNVSGAENVFPAYTAKIGDLSYATLADAVAAANAGDEIVMLAPAVVAAGETLELNKAVTITYTSNVPGEDMITNRGNLVIDGATLVYTNTDTTASNVTVSTISCEPGSNLEVKSGIVKNDSANNGSLGIYAFAIDLLTNGNLGDVTATISGGEIISTNYMAIRQFNNGDACKNTLNVTGGKIYGEKRAIQIHLKNDAAYTTISGGEIKAGEGGYALCFFPTNATNIAVTGGTFTGTVYSGSNGFISGGSFGERFDDAYCAEGYVTVKNSDGTFGVKIGEYTVQNTDTGFGYETLADALAAVQNGNNTIVLLADNSENVTIKQVEGVNIVIDGQNHLYTGTITIHGNARFKGAETLTIQNVEFVTSKAGHYFIDSNSTASAERYAHNVTVKDSTFTATGAGRNSAVAMRIRQGFDISIENVTASNMHSLFQGYGCDGLNVDDVTVSGKNGIAVGTSKNVEIKNADIIATGYGIRADGTAASDMTVENATIKAKLPIVVRENDADGYQLTMEGTNNLSGNANGYQVIFTAGDDGTYEAPAHAAVLSGIDNLNVFPAYQAKIGNVYYPTLAAAVAAAQAGDTIDLLSDVEASEVILIDKSLTINGNGKKIISDASRVIRVTASDVEVTLNEVNVVSNAVRVGTSDIRGVAVDPGLTNVKLTLNNSSVDFTDASANDWSYAVNVAGNGTGHTVTVNGGSYEGANVINVYGANNTVIVKDATLTSMYPNHEVYYGAIIWVMQNQGSSVEATGNTFNGSNAMVFNVGTGTAVTESNNTDNTTMCMAMIGDTYYPTLAAAVAAAQSGETVKVLHNTAEDLELDKAITLDLNGKNCTGTITLTAVAAELTAPENLNVTTNVGENYKVVYENGTYKVVGKVYVAEVNGVKYEKLSEAIANASAGDTITLIDNVEENVTIDRNLTIDGGNFEYTGTMTLKNVNLTVQNVKFVKGQISKNKNDGKDSDLTVRNCEFDGQGLGTYAINVGGVTNITIEDSNAKNYGYGLLQVNHDGNGTIVNVKNVEISDVDYGLKIDYAKSVNLENVDITAADAAVLNSNYGSKTITIKDSNLSILGTWKRNNTGKNTYVFEGANSIDQFVIEPAVDNFKLGAVDATLTAPQEIEVSSNLGENYKVVYENGTYKVVAEVYVAEVNGVKYEKLSEAIANASAGDTITLIDNVEENVTIDRNLTIDGGNFEYTGTMTLKNVNLTVQNVKFVKGQISKNKNDGKDSDLTVRNCEFDGQGLGTYAINVGGVTNITIEDSNAKNYGYGLLQVNHDGNGTIVNVKNVEISDVDYGLKIDYAKSVNLENVDITAADAAVLNSNYGTKTITIKDSNLSILGTWKRNNTGKTTYVFEGANSVDQFVIEPAFDNFKLGAVDATLTAPQEIVVTTEVAGYKVDYVDGTYMVAPVVYVAEVNGEKFETIQEAVNAAVDGGIVKVIADHEIPCNADPLVSVSGKSITIDLNGKAIVINAPASQTASPDVFRTMADGKLIIEDSVGTGSVTANGKDAMRFMFRNDGEMIIKSGSFKFATTVDHGIFYSNNSNMLIEGGNFEQTTVGWMFNTKGNGVNEITVTGGTFNRYFIGGKAYGENTWNEVVVPSIYALTDNGNGTWTIKNAVCYDTRTGFGYETLAEAIAVTNNITLVADVAEDAELTKSITLDVNGYAYTGTVTLPSTDVTLTAAEGLNVITNIADHKVVYAEGVYKVVAKVYVAQVNCQKFESIQEAVNAAVDGDTVSVIADHELACDVDPLITVSGKDITIDLNGKSITANAVGAEMVIRIVFETGADAKLTMIDSVGTGSVIANGEGILYYMFRNKGETNIKSGSYELAGYNGGAMFYSTNSNMLVEGGNFKQTTTGWMFNTDGNGTHVITVTGGTFNRYFIGGEAYGENKWGEVVIPSIYTLTDNGDGTWTIGDAACYNADTETGYASLTEAVAAAKTGETIVLLADTAENIVLDGKSITLDLNRMYMTGAITLASVDAELTSAKDLNVITTIADAEVVYENGIYKVKKFEYVAQNGETKYDDLSDALAIAQSGETVKVIANTTESLVMVPAGVTLDLNGHVVTADNVLSFGVVMDTASEVGGIAISNDTTKAFVKLQPENDGYLPLYDDTVSMYKFFKVTLQNAGVKQDGNKVKVGIRFLFENAEAYKVLANMQNDDMSLYVKLNWTGLGEHHINYKVSLNLITQYAAVLAANPASKIAMTITLYGAENIKGGSITATPWVETEAEFTTTAEEKTCNIT